jgi:hypothetical protein
MTAIDMTGSIAASAPAIVTTLVLLLVVVFPNLGILTVFPILSVAKIV